jgi:hypothetical protein
MKAPFENFHIKVDSILMLLQVTPQPNSSEECWDIVRWVEDAIREKLERERGATEC